MFGKLKDKLKNWVSKAEEDQETEEIIEESPKKKAKKALDKKEKSKPEKKKPEKKKKETITEEQEDIKEKQEEKKSFFSKFKKKPTDEKEEAEEESAIEEEVAEEIVEEKQEERKSFLQKFQKTFTEEKFETLFEELQLILLQNNVAYEAVESIENSLKKSLVGKKEKEVNLSNELKSSIDSLLINPPNFLDEIKSSKDSPFIILFAGINGSGKTTTIAKVANLLQKNSLTVCLAAADTFRAAAIQQLEEHAKNLKIPIVKKDYGSDPASVGFDAIKYAKKHKIDVVLIDTAGRMQNSDSLMKELEKISRVTSPNMKIFLGESTTGNDATLQAKAFNDSLGLTGIILSKADVDEAGGTALSVSHVTNKPILFLGTGQEYGDLEVFEKEKLIEKLGL